MLLTGDLIQRGVNVISSRLKPKKKKEKYSTKKTIDKTVETTDGIVIAVVALLILLMEVALIVFLFIRTIKEVPPGAGRNIRFVLIFLVPEIYGVAYFFLRKKTTTSFSFNK